MTPTYLRSPRVGSSGGPVVVHQARRLQLPHTPRCLQQGCQRQGSLQSNQWDTQLGQPAAPPLDLVRSSYCLGVTCLSNVVRLRSGPHPHWHGAPASYNPFTRLGGEGCHRIAAQAVRRRGHRAWGGEGGDPSQEEAAGGPWAANRALSINMQHSRCADAPACRLPGGPALIFDRTCARSTTTLVCGPRCSARGSPWLSIFIR
jgi:hypothetical protein